MTLIWTPGVDRTCSSPGAHFMPCLHFQRNGNMINYGSYKGYQGASRLQDGKPRATHIDDDRLKIIAERIDLRGKDVLDIGCNTGYITVQIGKSSLSQASQFDSIHSAALSYKAKSVTGIDIDEELLDRARSHLSFRYSRIYRSLPQNPQKKGKADNRLEQRPPPQGFESINYFPISAIQQYGHLPYSSGYDDKRELGDQNGGGGCVESGGTSNKRQPKPTCDPRLSHTTSAEDELPFLPESVKFSRQDWAAQGSEAHVQQGTYDVILALSVVKWLHLEHGDQGLHNFFRNCRTALRPGHGRLVIEIQPWESYCNAVKKHKAPQYKDKLAKLDIKPNQFDGILEELGLRLVESCVGLPREIKIYSKGAEQLREGCY